MLRPFRAEDASEVHALHVRHAAADVVDIRSTLDPVLDADGVRRRMTEAEWAVVALDVAGSVVGWGALRSWTETDRTGVYLTDGYVAPQARRQGLGTRLLRAAEIAAAEIAGAERAAGGGSGTGGTALVLGGNASTLQPHRGALLERNGYRHVFSMVEMEHDGPPAPPLRLPEGVTVRAAILADGPALLALAARAWAGRAYVVLPTEERLGDWLCRSELPLFQVATVGERMVGFVAASRTPLRAEIEDVQVDPAFQRRGLATAMLTRTLAMLAELGAGPVRLHTEGHDPAGARSLYARLGFRLVREYRRYRKPLRG